MGTAKPRNTEEGTGDLEDRMDSSRKGDQEAMGATKGTHKVATSKEVLQEDQLGV